MDKRGDTDFYASYERFKDYVTPNLEEKQIRRFDRDFWEPVGCTADMAVLEVGCGTGLFLAYLGAKGVGDFLGIDHDAALADVIPQAVATRFRAVDVWDFLDGGADGRTFDRVALFDVLEHFTVAEGARLLDGLGGVLRDGGRIVVRVPNMSSPRGLKYQFGDLTHRAAYTPDSLRQLAVAAGYRMVSAYPHEEGSPSRCLRDRLFHRLMARLVTVPSPIWTGNFFAVLERRAD